MRSNLLAPRPLQLALLLGAFSLLSCSLLVDSSIKDSGIGAPCASDSDCQASTCSQGICVVKCAADVDCPSPSTCVNSLCQLPLKVRGLWVGVISSGEGWTLTHQQAIDETKKDLGYLDFAAQEGVLASSAEQVIDQYVNQDGAQVIVANSLDHHLAMEKKAAQYPNVKFLICSGRANSTNLGSYYGHQEQAWFVAGKVAAQKATKNKRLGFVGTYITPEVVRHANAFLRGAQSVNPSIKMEVRWTGFWYDYNTNPTFVYQPKFMDGATERLYAEEYAAAKLIDSGCEVIIHQADNQRVTRYVEEHTKSGKLSGVWTLANDNQAGWKDTQGQPLSSALGSVYWNWTSLYSRVFDEIHRYQWTPSDIMDPLTQDTQTSTVGFELNPTVGVDQVALSQYISAEAKQGYPSVFEGPYSTTGQRDPVAAGEQLSEDEWRSMCWFAQGMVERSNPNDTDSADQPAKVPDDQVQPPDPQDQHPVRAPEILLSLPGLVRGVGWNCKENQAK